MHAFDRQTDGRTDFDRKTVVTHSQSHGKILMFRRSINHVEVFGFLRQF